MKKISTYLKQAKEYRYKDIKIEFDEVYETYEATTPGKKHLTIYRDQAKKLMRHWNETSDDKDALRKYYIEYTGLND